MAKVVVLYNDSMVLPLLERIFQTDAGTLRSTVESVQYVDVTELELNLLLLPHKDKVYFNALTHGLGKRTAAERKAPSAHSYGDAIKSIPSKLANRVNGLHKGRLKFPKRTPNAATTTSRTAVDRIASHPSTGQFVKIVLYWLHINGCRVINGWEAIELSENRALQVLRLKEYNLQPPKTFVCSGQQGLVHALENFQGRLFVKDLSGRLSQLFNDVTAAKKAIPSLLAGAGELLLVQEFVASRAVKFSPNIQKITYAGGSARTQTIADGTQQQDDCYELYLVYGKPALLLEQHSQRELDELPVSDRKADAMFDQCERLCVACHLDICRVTFKVDSRANIRVFGLSSDVGLWFEHEALQKILVGLAESGALFTQPFLHD